jgi:hypothetical protein
MLHPLPNEPQKCVVTYVEAGSSCHQPHEAKAQLQGPFGH